MHDKVKENVDYGPLAVLIGTWKGNEGMDVAPEPDDDERNPYYEVITFEPASDVTNAEEEVLAAVRYHQEVRRKSTGLVFHDQVGYWIWNAETGVTEVTCEGHPDKIISGDFSPDASYLLTAARTGHVSGMNIIVMGCVWLHRHPQYLRSEIKAVHPSLK